ncbi:MAG: heavy metal-responsive transcriptional regulator [Acidiferrobacterales bacterium]
MAAYRIGEISDRLGLSVDTLRYYEKISLLPRVARNVSGLRVYNNKDISRLQFIQRAQKMDFTLAEIGQLLKMREAPQKARTKARKLTQQKLAEIETCLTDLKALRDELRLLLSRCAISMDGCPIIEEIDKGNAPRNRRRSRAQQ